MPNGRCLPSGFGIYTRRTACGRYVFFRSSSASSPSHFVTAVLLDVLERLAVHARGAAVGPAALVGVPAAHPPGTPCRTARRSGSWVLSSLWHATPPAASQPLSGGARLIANLPAVATSYVVLELRPLPSTGITRLRRYYGPLRLPRRPGLSLAGVRLAHAATAGGLPCCVRSPCADMPSPLPRWDRRMGSSRSPGTDDGGLPHTSAGSAPTLNVSRPARRSLTLRPACSRSRSSDPFHRRLRQFRYLHHRSDCYRLERQLPGGNCTH